MAERLAQRNNEMPGLKALEWLHHGGGTDRFSESNVIPFGIACRSYIYGL